MNRERRISKVHLIHLLKTSIHPLWSQCKASKGSWTLVSPAGGKMDLEDEWTWME